VLCAGVLSPSAVAAEAPRQLWLYYPVNLPPEENIEKLEPIWRRAATASYTHVLLSDSKFSRRGQMPRNYFGDRRQLELSQARCFPKILRRSRQ
jgi:hypothetical protein